MGHWILVEQHGRRALYRSPAKRDNRTLADAFPEGHVRAYQDGQILFRGNLLAAQKKSAKPWFIAMVLWVPTVFLSVTNGKTVLPPDSRVISIEREPQRTSPPAQGAGKTETKPVAKRKKIAQRALPSQVVDPRTKRLFLEGYVMEDSNSLKSMEKYLLVLHHGLLKDPYVKKARLRLNVLKNAQRDNRKK